MRSSVAWRGGWLLVATVTLAAVWCAPALALEGRAAPLSPEFLRWRAAAATHPKQVAASRTGLVPSPFSLPAGKGVGTAPRALALPAKYDLRDEGRVGPARNQLPFGTCWAFATLGALESTLLPATAFDFSEDNMVLTAGFDTGEDDPYLHGGTFAMAAAYLLRGGGPVLESEDGYGDGLKVSGASPAVQVQEILDVPGGASGADTANVKYAVMTYGAVASTLLWDEKYYNAATGAYWAFSGDYANHAVLICGWDDAFPASAFATKPPGDGAWLARNSWGGGFGLDGYFWVSYYDLYCGAARGEQLTFGTVEPAGTYTDLYSYDPYGAVDMYGYALEHAWGANVFTAAADEDIVAVGFYAPVPSTAYSIYAGPSLTGLDKRGEGTFSMPGFHTVELSPAFPVTAGEKFVVAVRLRTPGSEYPIAVEYQMHDYTSRAEARYGQSYTRSDGSSWMDLWDWNGSANVCLKAYAGTPEVVLADVTAPVTEAAALDGGWHRRAVTVVLSASDPGPVASGVDYTEWSLDEGAWTRGDSVEIGGDGLHTLAYRSVDKAGNVEQSHAGTLGVDGTGPVCQVRPASVRYGAVARVRYRATDILSSQVSATVAVRTAGGVKLRMAPVGSPSGAWQTWAFRCTLKRGSYEIVVRATDAAGNPQSVLGRGTLRVD